MFLCIQTLGLLSLRFGVGEVLKKMNKECRDVGIDETP